MYICIYVYMYLYIVDSTWYYCRIDCNIRIINIITINSRQVSCVSIRYACVVRANRYDMLCFAVSRYIYPGNELTFGRSCV